MLNLLRSDLFRLVRQLRFWVLSAFTAIMCVFVAGMLAWVASPEFATYVNDATYEQMADAINEAENTEVMAELTADAQESLSDAETLNDKVMVSLSHTWAQTFLTGGLLGVMGSIVALLFLASDFKGGFVRNVVSGRRSRVRYYGEKLIFVTLVQMWYVAVCAASTAVAFWAYGFTYEWQDAAGALAVWLLLAWLLASAYALAAACVTWLTRSEWLGTVFAIMVSSGMTGGLLASVCQLLSAPMPWLTDVPYFTLYGCTRMLGEGAQALVQPTYAMPLLDLPPIAGILLVEGVVIAVCVAVAFGACRRKDI